MSSGVCDLPIELETYVELRVADLQEELRSRYDMDARPILLHFLCKKMRLAIPTWWPQVVKHPIPRIAVPRTHFLATSDVEAYKPQPLKSVGGCKTATVMQKNPDESGLRTIRAIANGPMWHVRKPVPARTAELGKYSADAHCDVRHMAHGDVADLTRPATARSVRSCENTRPATAGSSRSVDSCSAVDSAALRIDSDHFMMHVVDALWCAKGGNMANLEALLETPLAEQFLKECDERICQSPESTALPPTASPSPEIGTALWSTASSEILDSEALGPVPPARPSTAGGRRGSRPQHAQRPVSQRPASAPDSSPMPASITSAHAVQRPADPLRPTRQHRPTTARRGGRSSLKQEFDRAPREATPEETAELEAVVDDAEHEVIFSSDSLAHPVPLVEERAEASWLERVEENSAVSSASASCNGQSGLQSLRKLQAQISVDMECQEVRMGNMREVGDNLQRTIQNFHLKHHEALLNRVPLLSLDILTPEEQYQLIMRLKRERMEPGAYICREGDPGNALYILESGRLEITRKIGSEEALLATLDRGNYFGERAAFSSEDEPRNASIRVAPGNYAQVLRISSDSVLEVLGIDRVQELRHLSHVQLLERLPAFKLLANQQRLSIARRFLSQSWACGQVIAPQGDKSRRMYTIEIGEATLSCSSSAAIRPHLHDTSAIGDVLSNGQQVGLLNLCLGSPLPVMIKAKSNFVVVLTLEWEDLVAASAEAEILAGAAELTLLQTMRVSIRSHLLRMWDLLSKRDEDMLKRIVERSEVKSLEHWAKLARKGERLDSVYFLEEGSIVVANKAIEEDSIVECGIDVVEHTLPGSHFGVESWQDPYAKAQHTLVAGSRSVVLRVPKTVLREVVLVPGVRRCSVSGLV